jgi:uncharacterized membrane protein YphA (DoxX/SURF4 family)
VKAFASLLNHPHARLLFRLVVGGVFIAASLDKVQNPAAFSRAVSYYHVLPPEVINVFALVVPWVELLGGIALIVGLGSRGAGLVIGGLLVIFIVALISAIARGIDISCGCFSTAPGEGHKVGYDLVVRDILMLVATVPLLLSGGGTLSLDDLLRARAPRAQSPERSAP